MQLLEIVATADMCVIEEDLRHGRAAIGAFRHLLPRFAIAIDRNLGKGEILLIQKVLRRAAIGASRRGINRDFNWGRHYFKSSGLPGRTTR
jgi:hypothetical protein